MTAVNEEKPKRASMASDVISTRMMKVPIELQLYGSKQHSRFDNSALIVTAFMDLYYV
jgi:hypothetical protein